MSVLLCSCSFSEGEFDLQKSSEQKVANKKFEEILEVLQSQNGDSLYSMFSANSIKSTEGFDKTINELFKYFIGEVKSYDDWGACYVETSKENDEIIQVMESTYDVKTTAYEYRFAIRDIVINTVDSNDIGIQSLYIIKKVDDAYPEYAYWGDGKFTPGINIGIPNIE